MGHREQHTDAGWKIELLGSLRATRGERVVTRFRGQKNAALLAYLALYPQHPQPREALIELLWPEIDPEVGRTNLRSALHSLRRELEPTEASVGTVLITDRQTVRFNPAAFSTDVAALREGMAAAARAEVAGERAELLARATAVYRGELLPGFSEPWVVAERQQVAETYLAALHQLAAALEQTGDLEGALEAARQAVSADPLREEAHYDLMRLYAAAGQPAGTVKQYQELERLLRDELGETPSAATRALADELRESARTVVAARSLVDRGQTAAGTEHRDVAALGHDRPALSAPSIAPRPTSTSFPASPRLPVQLTRFFGREAEIARLTEILRVPETRLVTLTGPGGSGKTRLAVAVAGRLQEEFEDRVWFVPLAEVREAPRLGEALREGMSLPPDRGTDPLTLVFTALRERPALLVLDNFEQLVEDGAAVLHSLLAQLPALTCLVTSRERLELAGEQEFVVLPLPTPVECGKLRVESPAAVGTSGLSTLNAQLSTLLHYSSVQLFVDRAQAARPGFQLSAENAAAVAALCDRLEGLPLAIELAAARASVLTPEQTLARLSQRFDLLVSDQRDRSARHRTLRAAIEWSYQQLSPELQRFFARLSVFRGGWTLEAAEAIAGVGDEELGVGAGNSRPVSVASPPLTPNSQPLTPALDCLERLRKCSLMIAEEAGAAMRYRLLEMLREYGAEQLTPEQKVELSQRHAEYFAQLAEQAEAERTDGEQQAWSERLAREHDNLRAALTWGLKAVDSGQWLAVSPQEAELGASPALSALTTNPYPPTTAIKVGVRLAAALWWFWPYQGLLPEGREWLEQALRRAGSAPSRARARLLMGIGELLLLQGDFKSAHTSCEESLRLFQEGGDLVGTAQVLYQIGWVAYHQNDLARTRTFWEESLSLQRQMDHKAEMIQTLRHLWRVVVNLGDRAGAQSLYEAELALMQEFGGAAAAAAHLVGEADRAREAGDLAALRTTSAQALAFGQQFGNDQEFADALSSLGVSARDMGEYELARALLEQSLAMNRALERQLRVHSGLWSLAQVARLQDDLTAARAWAEESLRVALEAGSKEPVAHSLDELRLVALKQGDWKTARSLPQDSLALWLEMENYWGLAEALEGVAHLAGAEGQAARAARLFGAARRLRETIGRPQHPYERTDYERGLAEARTALGDAAFAAAWAEGRELSPQEAVADARQP